MSKNTSIFSRMFQAAAQHIALTLAMVTAAAVAVAAVVWLAVDLNRDNSISVQTNEGIDLTPTQIQSIRRIGQWAFLTVHDEEMVDTVRHGVFSDDELVRIYYGTLQIGIDLSEAKDGWITHVGDSAAVLLPAVKLLDPQFIDEARTRSFIEKGSWTPADRKHLYNKDCTAMMRRCLTTANYRSAELQAADQFDGLMRSMGFRRVSIRFEKSR